MRILEHCEIRSGAETRWEYERIKEPIPRAAILVDPAHQIVEQERGSKEIW
jgi:hypothetical protein